MVVCLGLVPPGSPDETPHSFGQRWNPPHVLVGGARPEVRHRFPQKLNSSVPQARKERPCSAAGLPRWPFARTLDARQALPVAAFRRAAVRHEMPRYERTARDVNDDEEAELRRLSDLPVSSTIGVAVQDALLPLAPTTKASFCVLWTARGPVQSGPAPLARKCSSGRTSRAAFPS